MRKNKEISNDSKLLFISVVSFFIVSISFLIMPIETAYTINNLSITSFISGICFWIFLIIGIINSINLKLKQKKWLLDNNIKIKKKTRVLYLFQNKISKFFDILLILSVICFIFFMILSDATSYICYIDTAIVVFSLSMHCIFGSECYYIINNKVALLNNIDRT